jgi:hypothetical protein
LTGPPRHSWAATNSLEIVGEYFFAGGDVSAIRLYAQRLSDGFEFDIPIDVEKTTKTKIVANLPVLTSDLDTGRHRLYVKVAGFASNTADIWLDQPAIKDIITGTIIDKIGDVKQGQEISFVHTVKPGWEHAMARYYKKENLQSMSIGVAPIAGGNGRHNNITDMNLVSITDGNKITIKLDPNAAGNPFAANTQVFGGVTRYTSYAPAGPGSTQYQFELDLTALLWTVIRTADFTGAGDGNYAVPSTLVQEGQQIHTGQELIINYSFTDANVENKYKGKLRAINLGFKTTDGQYQFIDGVSSFTDDGSKVTFNFPETEAALKGSSLVVFSLYFSAGFRESIEPRSFISTNTVVAN